MMRLPSVFMLAALLLLTPLLARAEGKVLLVELQGAIGPASSRFVQGALERARNQNAGLVILRLDTPGGLDSSMRDIIQSLLASPIPVAVYVAPEGARAASAGTYILYASHLAAMAPATNLGAATPVQIGGSPTPDRPEEPPAGKKPEDRQKADRPKEGSKPEPHSAMERKMINDARAYIRALAQLRKRNADWAEQAVTGAASLSAEDALKQGVIDLIAVDVPDLLRQANGRIVQVAGQARTLATQNSVVETLTPDWRQRLLGAITHPQVAYILLLLGVYGLFFELAHPGVIAPGVLGGICLLIALFALQVLPINYAGLGLLLLGLLFMIAEAFVPSFGILGLGGIFAFIAGSLLLWDETGPGFELPVGIVLGFALASTVLFIGLGNMLLRQRRRPVVTGAEELLGAGAVALEDFSGTGRVWVHSESWQAHSDRPLRKGERVRVTGRKGLVLQVQSLNKEEKAE
ncbi:MAG: nodulation protein NfeD [Candidatus Competibacteraceae bacterium]